MNETIRQIANWIRERNPTRCYYGQFGPEEISNEMRQLADRIEAALERQVSELRNENARLLDENYQLRNELRIAKKKEEEIKYEYAVQPDFNGVWCENDRYKRIYHSIDVARDAIQRMRDAEPAVERIIVRRKMPTDWEVVE